MEKSKSKMDGFDSYGSPLSHGPSRQPDMVLTHRSGPIRGKQEDIDSGWAWMVLLACTMWNFILGGTIKTFGLLYVEFLDLFYPSSPSHVGLIGLVCGFVAIIVSPLAGRLSDVYGSRQMAMIGGVISALGMALTGISQTLPTTIFTYGGLVGIGMGIMDGPILAMIGKYFHRRRTLASGIAFAGSSIGNLAMAPIMALAIDAYTIKGAMLILAGVWLHACVAGALLRPVTFSDNIHLDLEMEITQEDLDMERNKKDRMSFTSSEVKHETNFVPAIKDKVNLKDIRTGNTNENYKDNNGKLNSRNTHIDLYTSQTLSSHQSTFILMCVRDSSYIQFLSNSRMLITLFVLGCGMYGYYAPITVLPACVNELGLKKIQGAWLISILGIIEIVSRIAITYLSDRFIINNWWLLRITYIVIGVIGQIVVFYPCYTALVVYVCFHGCIGGLCMVLMSSLLCECVGVDQLGSAMGLVVMELNLAASLSSPTAGAMQELTGTYVNVIRLSSAVYLLGGFVSMITIPQFRSTKTLNL